MRMLQREQDPRESPQCAQQAALPCSTQATMVVRGVSISAFCVA